MIPEPAMTDRDFDLLSAYLDEALSTSERADLERRLSVEPALRAALDDLRRMRALLRALPPLRAPRDFALTAAQARRPPAILTFAASPAVTLISAAAAVILIAAGVLLSAAPSGRFNAPDTVAVMATSVSESLPLTETVTRRDSPTLIATDAAEIAGGAAAIAAADSATPIESPSMLAGSAASSGAVDGSAGASTMGDVAAMSAPSEVSDPPFDAAAPEMEAQTFTFESAPTGGQANVVPFGALESDLTLSALSPPAANAVPLSTNVPPLTISAMDSANAAQADERSVTASPFSTNAVPRTALPAPLSTMAPTAAPDTPTGAPDTPTAAPDTPTAAPTLTDAIAQAPPAERPPSDSSGAILMIAGAILGGVALVTFILRRARSSLERGRRES